MSDDEWIRAREIMGRAIRGERVKPAEHQLLTRLWQGNRAKYRKLHAEVRAEATAEINPLA